jgi:hypothetical protein
MKKKQQQFFFIWTVGAVLLFFVCVVNAFKGELAIVAMRLWSQGSLPKKGSFLGAFWIFLYGMEMLFNLRSQCISDLNAFDFTCAQSYILSCLIESIIFLIKSNSWKIIYCNFFFFNVFSMVQFFFKS